MHTLTGHRDHVLDVAFSPDGSVLASGGRDLTIRLWDTETLQLKAVLTGPTNDIHALGFSPDRRMLASADADGWLRCWETYSTAPCEIKLWDARTAQELAMFMLEDLEVHDVEFSPDGQSLLAAGGSDESGQILEWSIEPKRSSAAVPLSAQR